MEGQIEGFESEDEVRPLLMRGSAACSFSASTVPSSPASSVGTPDVSTDNLPYKGNWEEPCFPKNRVQYPSPSAVDSARGRKPLDVGDDFGENTSLRSLFGKFRAAARRVFLHPASLSPLLFHHSYFLPRGDTEHDLGDLVQVPSSRSAPLAVPVPSGPASWLPSNKLLPTDSLVAGLTLRGCVGEMAGTFAVAFFVHAAARAASLGSNSAGEGENGPEAVFTGWGLAARLALLLYAVGAVLGFFCNPAFLYAGYIALSRSSPSSTGSRCDVSRMNCFSINLLVCLQYLAAGAGAFFALYVLPFDRQSAEAAAKEDLLFGPHLAWPALTEALGACLMGAAVLQLIALSSFFRTSRQEVSSLNSSRRRVDGAPGDHVAASSVSSSLRRSFFSRPFLFSGKKEDPLVPASAPQNNPGKPPAWAVALPFFLLLLAFSLPASRSAFNPAIAYTSNCARREAASFFFAQRGSGASSETPGPVTAVSATGRRSRGDVSVVRTPGADPQQASPRVAGAKNEAGNTDGSTQLGGLSVARAENGTFIELESSSSPAETASRPPGVVSSRVVSSSNSSALPSTAASSVPSLASASAGPRLPGVVALSLLDVEREKREVKRTGASEQDGQSLPASASEFFDEESEQVGGLPTFLLPPGMPEREDVEGIQILDREEGDGEILFEFDEACATASPWFSFFLLFSVAPYFGAFAAAVLWKRFGNMEKHSWLQANASLNSGSF
ncbi:conserved hypothetical protein [Neospora caninum Liverpool]|uniref:Transmembrane protein n=1 Tax=Neospora caninum (strain Liverpool) TaxID=572307 RepID=F0VHX6_NEOCL|nr:conserved hypothetical protein [Neospora caninum Liverpool]CBZ53337.1 conserved hypothetical protein [Neospora caninum Liverpool]CEL67322.1 TPA: hypothetical protein BN1204_031240 [Neospora caninum Liverpool]|eukprot:XP_003883369.1 conserved hypothetical protein [Neospora caninum Liverpool]